MAFPKRGLAIILDEHEEERLTKVTHVGKISSMISRDKFGKSSESEQGGGRCKKRTYRDSLVDAALVVSEVGIVAFLVYYGWSEEEANAGEWCTTTQISVMDLLQSVFKSLIYSVFSSPSMSLDSARRLW